jgi:hypothetical protein
MNKEYYIRVPINEDEAFSYLEPKYGKIKSLYKTHWHKDELDIKLPHIKSLGEVIRYELRLITNSDNNYPLHLTEEELEECLLTDPSEINIAKLYLLK